MSKQRHKRANKGERARRLADERAAERIEEQRRLAKRAAIAGGDPRGVDVGFPPDVLLARNLITREMRDEGLRFAQLAWWLYGTPTTSCARLYARVAAGGAGGDDFSPFRADDPAENVLRRIQRNKRRFERMVVALGGITGKGEILLAPIGGRVLPFRLTIFAASAGTMYAAVRSACQYLEMPPLNVTPGASSSAALKQLARLIDGLGKPLELCTAEDRHLRRKHAPAISPTKD